MVRRRSCDERYSTENTKLMMQYKPLNLSSSELKIFRVSAKENAVVFNMPEVLRKSLLFRKLISEKPLYPDDEYLIRQVSKNVIRKGGIMSNIEVLNYEKTNVLNKDRITRGLTNIRKIISNPCYGQSCTINPDYGRLVIVCPDDGYKINASSANVHLIIECPNYKCIVNNSSVYGDSDTYNPKRGQAENLDKNSGKQGQNYQKKSINSYLTASNDNVKGNSYSTRDKIKNNTQGAKTGVHDTSQRNSQAWQDSESISNHSDSHEETQRQEDSLPKHLKLKGHSKLQMGSKWNLAC